MTLSEDDHQPSVDRAIAEARATDPGLPPGFSAMVMRRVHEADADFSTLRRWKRARVARGVGLSPVGAAGAKKILWSLATVGATAMIAMFYFGAPHVGPGTQATVGGATPPAPAVSATVTLGTMTVQQVLQSDTFAGLLRNESARAVLDRAVRDQAFRNTLTQPALRAGITDPAFQRAATDPAFQALLAWPSFEAALATPEFQAAVKPIK
jgi:hypothetical protein